MQRNLCFILFLQLSLLGGCTSRVCASGSWYFWRIRRTPAVQLWEFIFFISLYYLSFYWPTFQKTSYKEVENLDIVLCLKWKTSQKQEHRWCRSARRFLHHFVLAKLATSSIRVKHYTSLYQSNEQYSNAFWWDSFLEIHYFPST